MMFAQCLVASLVILTTPPMTKGSIVYPCKTEVVQKSRAPDSDITKERMDIMKKKGLG